MESDSNSESSKFSHDFSCVPFKHKKEYLIYTISFLAICIGVFIFLLTNKIWIGLIYLYLYLHTAFFQSFCCIYEECPYIGGFCPAIIGILPAPIIAKWMKSRLKAPIQEKHFKIYMNIAFIGFFGFLLYPLFWLFSVHWILGVLFLLLEITYYIVFSLRICPNCAIRDTCPGGKLSKKFKK
ncbi:MAG: hypothetical protein ABEK36_01100 [Candidatus Aenigmatarchaeota archaeon]